MDDLTMMIWAFLCVSFVSIECPHPQMSEEEWRRAYRSFSGGEGRHACADPELRGTCDHGEGPDGLKNYEPREDFMFEQPDFCSSVCRVVESTKYPLPDGTKRKVVDCRTDEEIESERLRGINQEDEAGAQGLPQYLFDGKGGDLDVWAMRGMSPPEH